MATDDREWDERYNAMRKGCEVSHLEAYALKQNLERFSSKVCAGGLAPNAPAQHTHLAARVCAAVKAMEELIDLCREQQDAFIIPVAAPEPCEAIADEGV